MATTDQIRSTIERYAKAMTAGDKDGWVELFAEGATVEDPVGTDVRTGKASIAEFWDFVRSLTPEMDLELTGPVNVVGHEAAFAFAIVAGSDAGKLRVEIIDVMTFDDDARITSMRAFWAM